MYTEIDLELRQQKVDRLVEKYGEHLYHYTSFPALYGILKNREIWLGNTISMNDELENRDFVDRLYKEVRGSLEAEEQKRCDEFFALMEKRLLNKYPFAACFSRAKEDAAQWDRYSDNGTGVCIVFDSKVLISLFYYQMVVFNPVYYLYEARAHQHYRLLCEYFKTQKLKNYKNEMELVDNILVCASTHKHYSFQSECEVRLATLWNNNLENTCAANIEYVVTDNRIKKILKVSLECLCKGEKITFEDLIDHIIIGPRSLQTKNELKDFILSLGMKKIAERITASECPLK